MKRQHQMAWECAPSGVRRLLSRRLVKVCRKRWTSQTFCDSLSCRLRHARWVFVVDGLVVFPGSRPVAPVSWTARCLSTLRDPIGSHDHTPEASTTGAVSPAKGVCCLAFLLVPFFVPASLRAGAGVGSTRMGLRLWWSLLLPLQ